MKNVLTPSLHGVGVHVRNVIPCIVGIFYSLYDLTMNSASLTAIMNVNDFAFNKIDG
jgi:hypothetical protein